MKIRRAEELAYEVYQHLQPYCSKFGVAGSIRRRKPEVKDIDIVLIPSNPELLSQEISLLGPLVLNGEKVKRVIYQDIQVDIYYATPETWASLLLIRTGSKENNIRLASIAKRKGWKLCVSGHGLFDENGDRIAGDNEESVYQALGIPYEEPWERR